MPSTTALRHGARVLPLRHGARVLPLRDGARTGLAERGLWQHGVHADLAERGLWQRGVHADLAERGLWQRGVYCCDVGATFVSVIFVIVLSRDGAVLREWRCVAPGERERGPASSRRHTHTAPTRFFCSARGKVHKQPCRPCRPPRFWPWREEFT